MSIGLVLRLIAIAAFIGIVYMAYSQGKSIERNKLTSAIKDGRITVLKKGKEIDDEIVNFDGSDLCAVLGGCDGVPNN